MVFRQSCCTCFNSLTQKSLSRSFTLNAKESFFHRSYRPEMSGFRVTTCGLGIQSTISNACRTTNRSYRSWTSPSSLSVNRRKHCRFSNKNLVLSPHTASNFFSMPGSGLSPVKRKEYSERRILGYTMEQMFDVVADVEKYHIFLPWCQSSIIKSRRKNHLVADLVVGINPLVESYTSSVTMTRPYVIKAEATQGKLFNHLVNLWKFSPGLKGKPQTCIVDFYVSFDFRSALTSQVANVFFNEVVRAMVVAFYNEARKRYGTESIPSRKIVISDK